MCVCVCHSPLYTYGKVKVMTGHHEISMGCTVRLILLSIFSTSYISLPHLMTVQLCVCVCVLLMTHFCKHVKASFHFIVI